MSMVFALEGSVVSLEYLNRIREWMEEVAAEENKLSFTKTKLNNVEYHKDTDSYTFVLEFWNEN